MILQNKVGRVRRERLYFLVIQNLESVFPIRRGSDFDHVLNYSVEQRFPRRVPGAVIIQILGVTILKGRDRVSD